MSKLDALQNLVVNDLCSFRDPFFEGMEQLPSTGSVEGETGIPEAQDFCWRVLEAGGSAASIGAELIRRRCNLRIANRTPARAKALAVRSLEVRG